MPVGGKENSREQSNDFAIPREAISPTSENVDSAQAEAREKINLLVHYLSKGVTWPQGEDSEFDKNTLTMVLNILRPGLPSTIIDSLSGEVLAFRLKVIQEITELLRRTFPNSPRLENWVQYDYVSEIEPAWKEVQNLFSLPRENLEAGLEKVATSMGLLYEHDPAALKNLISWQIDTLDSDKLQAGLFK